MSSHLQQVALLLAAQNGPEGGPGGCAGRPDMLLPIILIAILYFVWIRPASRERKQHQEMLDQLKRGDEVITNSGIIGTITDMSERIITLEVARNVKIKVIRSAVAKTTADLKAKESEGSSDDKSASKAK